MRAIVAAALLPAVLVATMACGSSGEDAAPATAGVPDTLQFAGTTLDGKKFDAASLAGKPTVLWFWAPWCATCFGQAPAVAEDATEYAGRVNFLGVAGLGDAKDMVEFVDDGEVGNVPHLNDAAGAVWRKFGITEQSHFVMLDRAGTVVQQGYMDADLLSQWVGHIAK